MVCFPSNENEAASGEIPTAEDISCQDTTCQVCDMVYMIFPPLTTMMLEDAEITCICFEHRMRIAYKWVDSKIYKKSLSLRLVRELERTDNQMVVCPPIFKQRGWALSYLDWQYAQMTSLIAMCADERDPGIIRRALLENQTLQEDGATFFTGNR